MLNFISMRKKPNLKTVYEQHIVHHANGYIKKEWIFTYPDGVEETLETKWQYTETTDDEKMAE